MWGLWDSFKHSACVNCCSKHGECNNCCSKHSAFINCWTNLEFVLWQFHTHITLFWVLEPYLTHIFFLPLPPTNPHSIFMTLSLLCSDVHLFVFSNPWVSPGSSVQPWVWICLLEPGGLPSGDPTEDTVFPFPRICKQPVVHQEGCGPISSTLIQGWLLIGPGLCGPISGKHSWSWLVGCGLPRKQHFVTFLYIFPLLRSSHPHLLLWCSLSLTDLGCWRVFYV